MSTPSGQAGRQDGPVLAPAEIDSLVEQAVFGDEAQARESRQRITAIAREQGTVPASIWGLYQAAGKGIYQGRTVPAINIRGITYQVARAVFQAAIKDRVGPFIFEIARSEMGYTAQRPAEYTACVLAAAIREGFKGMVFLQGDHFQVNARRYQDDPKKEIDGLKDLAREAIEAGFYNIDIDASTLVDLSQPKVSKQQEPNYRVTAEMSCFIRSIEPPGTTVCIGGEIGEVGGRNSTVEDLRAFMDGYLDLLGEEATGISKISVQTGTTHGGLVLPDGSVAKVKLDFDTLAELSRVAREEYGLAGAVQHGASTLPDEAFDLFPRSGAAEIHLATGFQNIIYDSPFFPQELRDRIYQHLTAKYASERKPGDTDTQFIYKTRKKGFGDFKREMWSLPQETLKPIREELQQRFSLLFYKLNVRDTAELISRYATVTRAGR